MFWGWLEGHCQTHFPDLLFECLQFTTRWYLMQPLIRWGRVLSLLRLDFRCKWNTDFILTWARAKKFRFGK